MRISKFVAAGLAGWIALGCAKKKDESAAAPTPTVAEDPLANADPLLREMVEVTKNCKVNVEHSVVSQCQDKEKQDLLRDFRRGERDKLKSLPVLAEALAGSDDKLQTVAARILEGAYRASFGNVQAGAVDKATATSLLTSLPKLGKRQANQALPATVHAAMLAGEQDALFKLLDGLEDKAMQSAGYSHLLVHGGASALAKINELSKSPDVGVVAGALQAARSYKGEDAAIKAELCKLGEGKLPDADAVVAMRAAQIVVKCGEGPVDQLLTELERRDQAKTITPGLVRSLYELCQVRKDTRLGTDAQCARTRTLLEKWIQNKDIGSEIRGAALFEIGVQFPDEKSEKLCQKYEEDADLRVKTAAKESLRRIQRKLGKQVVTVGAPGSSAARPAGTIVPRPGGSGALAPRPVPAAPKPPSPPPPAPPPPAPAAPKSP